MFWLKKGPMTMEIKVGHYYQDGNGQVVKVLEREQKQMFPPTDEKGHLETDPAHMVTVDCFRCRDYEGYDFYALPTGQMCQMWKGEGGQPVYSLPAYPSHSDFVKEADPKDIERERYENGFITTWRLESSLLLTLKIRAKNAESAYDQLPPIGEVKKALSLLFSSTGIELEEVSYEHDEIEEEEAVNDD
jgi:hypothetical protein